MPTRKKAIPRETYINNNLPVLYVDDVDTHRRADGIYYLRFTTNIPDFIVEQVRLITNDDNLHLMIDDLCLNANYFPKRPGKKEG